MSAPLPDALRMRFQRLIEEGSSGRAAALHLKLSPATGARWALSIRRTGRRVRIRGTLNYDETGNVLRMVGGTVAFIDVAPVYLDKLEDRDFTEGYSVSEYLDRLRENEFG